MKIARVFPRRTAATPDDPLAFTSLPPRKGLPEIDEVHVSVAFTYDMLQKQKEKPVFTGGLEARLLRPWHVDLLRASRARRMYFAYDTPDDYAPLVEAGRLLRAGGITQASQRAACYVLIGFKGDTMAAADKRLRDTWAAGFVPYAMLYRDEAGAVDPDWRKFQRLWVRPEIVLARLKKAGEIDG